MSPAESFEAEKDLAKVGIQEAQELNKLKLEDEQLKELDVAGKFLAEIASRPDGAALLSPHTEKEERDMLRKKVDPIIMTLCQFALMMGAVDKVCVGTAAVLGMRTDNHLVGQDYSWVSSIIYFGAITAVFPSLYLMQRLPAAKWIASNTMCWGIILMAMAACKSFAGLMVARYILGLTEACIFGGFGLIVAMWWKKEEQPWRTAVIFSTLSSVVNSIISYGCVLYAPTAKLHQWQLLFICVGAITFVWSIMLFFFLPNSPTTTWWLTDRQKVIAVRRTQSNHAGMENKSFKMEHVLEAVKDPKTWLIFLINFCLNVPNGGIISFQSIIVNSLGFTLKQTTLLAIPTGVISWISSLLMAYIAVKTKKRFLVTIIGCLFPFAGTIMLHTIPRSNIGGSLAGIYILYLYWGPYTNTMSIMYANTGGYTKKIFVYAASYCGYAVGNSKSSSSFVPPLVGPQTFRANQAPGYTGAIVAMLACYIAAMVLLALFWFYTTRLNKQKEAQLDAYLAARGGKEDILEDWHDQTDFENPYFRYAT